jgi:hypothetical protein
LILACLLLLPAAFSTGAATAEEPPKPVAPPAPPMARKIPENPFRCDRLVRYRGKTLPCDSALRRDGESLRAIMDGTPDALEELDDYQSGRNSIRYAAYTGTAGLVLALGSGLLTDLFIDESRQTARTDTSKVLRWTGLGITFGGVVWGLSHLRSNEDHLQQAVVKFNAAHPDRPIEIQFQTEF